MSLRRILALASLAICASSSTLSAQTLVRDVNQVPADPIDSNPRFMVGHAGLVYFSAGVPGLGNELCVSDGTPAGTSLLLDVLPGPKGGTPRELYSNGPNLFYSALQLIDFGPGLPLIPFASLFVSDGTVAGIELFDATPDGYPTAPAEFTEFAGATYFAARLFNGRWLWRSDGTEGGTQIAFDSPLANEPPVGLEPLHLTVGDDRLFFSGRTLDVGRELWVLDDLGNGAPIPGPEIPEDLTWHDGELYFRGTSDGARKLFRTDGTAAGTVLAADFGGDDNPRDIVSYGGDVFFTIAGQVWRTSGTPASATMITTVNGAAELTVAGSDLYLRVQEELWVSNGTPAGTRLYPGGTFMASPRDLTPLGDLLLFAAGAGPDEQLWVADGTSPAFEIELNPFGPSEPDEFVEIDGELWFVAIDDAGAELWRTDGSASGTVRLSDFGPTLTAPSAPELLGGAGGRLYFEADDGLSGRELWVSDGTEPGTELVVDLSPGPAPSRFEFLTEIGEHAVFLGTSVSQGLFENLWRTDETTGLEVLIPWRTESLSAAGGAWYARVDTPATGKEPWLVTAPDGVAALILDVRDGPGSSDPEEFTELPGGRVLFTADDGVHGGELWVSDGTEAGTTLVADLQVGPDGSFAAGLERVGDQVFFLARQPASFQRALWVTDGTAAGTEIVSTALSAFPRETWTLGDRYLVRTTSDSLWSSDGTEAGTEELLSFHVNEVVVTDSLAFVGRGTNASDELHVTDGTLGGTNQVLDADAAGVFRLEFLTRAGTFGDAIWFAAGFDDDGDSIVADAAVWFSDGTAAGTVPAADLDAADQLPAETNAALDDLYAPGGGSELLLAGRTLGEGLEPWIANGTLGGELQLADLAPGPVSSNPRDFVRVGETVYFVADDSERGEELYSIPFRDLGGWYAEPLGHGCAAPSGDVPRFAPGGQAKLGESFELGLRDATPSSAALLFVGASLATVTAGECTLYMGLAPQFVAIRLTDPSGAAALSLTLQNDPSLLAAPLYFQWLVLDDGPFLGVGTLSDGLEVQIGP